MNLDMDFDSFTVDELEVIEDYCGRPFVEVLDGNLTAKAMKALAYVALRRTEPDATWADAGAVKLTDMRFDEEIEDVPPT
jgi:hypothetical protein